MHQVICESFQLTDGLRLDDPVGGRVYLLNRVWVPEMEPRGRGGDQREQHSADGE